ncbi:MAG: protein phosphatase CheZ [Dongiaceae bacterium]
MRTSAVSRDVSERLDALQKRSDRIDPGEIVEVVEGIMGTMRGDLSTAELDLYAELGSLGKYIADAKAEISSLRPNEIRDQHLPIASDELDAIVGATEQATNGILEAVETIEGLTQDMSPEVAEKVTEAVTRVYESCNFQDITGQRVTKVVKALKQIEASVIGLLAAFGDDSSPAARPAAPSPDEAPVDHELLNGPQLPGEATTQADIDALLAGGF